jgi:cytochrome c-type biogenesis protein CcmE
MTRKQRRLAIIGGIGFVLAIAGGLTLFGLSRYINVFRTPSMVVDEKIGPAIAFRLGGMVENGSLKRGDGTSGTFVIVDCKQSVTVAYNQILPDLFREGQHAVAEGALDNKGVFVASNVLARHDENYIPREVADEMRKQGHNLDSMTCEPPNPADKTAAAGNGS